MIRMTNRKDNSNGKNGNVNSSVALLKQIDYIAGPFLLKMAAIAFKKMKIKSKNPVTFCRSCSGQDVSHILIVRPGGIGDAVLLIPSLKFFKTTMPKVKIDILCEPRNREIFMGLPWVESVLSYRNMKDILYMTKNRYEIVFDTEQSHFLSAVFVAQFRHSFKVGFSTNGRENIYDLAIRYHHDQYEMGSFFRLFRATMENWPARMSLEPPYFCPEPEEKTKVDKLISGIKRPIACIFPGASIKQRHWPVTRWIKVAENLWEKGFGVVVLGGKNECTTTFEIAEYTCCPVMNMCGRLSLSETAILFKKASFLISTDSGILHLGVLSELPTISLFGPGIAKKWGPRGKKHIILNKKLSCSPCTRFGETPPCPSGGKCMDVIKENDVIKAVSELMESKIIDPDDF